MLRKDRIAAGADRGGSGAVDRDFPEWDFIRHPEYPVLHNCHYRYCQPALRAGNRSGGCEDAGRSFHRVPDPAHR